MWIKIGKKCGLLIFTPVDNVDNYVDYLYI